MFIYDLNDVAWWMMKILVVKYMLHSYNDDGDDEGNVRRFKGACERD